MKKMNRMIVAISGMLCLLCMYLVVSGTLSGCQSTDTVQKTTQARTAYTGVLTAIHQEYQAGKITRAQLDTLEPYKLSIDAALNAMQASDGKDPNAWASAYQNFTEAMAAFNSVYRPATQPAAP